ncbi:retrovirus-related pol polyprotein from transposon TNT 1-94 [Tanacetum coccineum]
MTAGLRKPENQWTRDERKAANLDQRLKSLIMSVLSDDQINSVINCLTAKLTWDDLILYYEGPSDVKEINDGIKLSKLEINTDFINGLPKKWLSFCQSLRKSNNVKDSELASLFGKLKYEENLIDSIYETEKNKSLVSATPLSIAFFSSSIVQDFQDSPNDEEDTRSSHEYLNDLEEEYQARALLAKSKRFFKKGLIIETYEWEEEEVSSDDNEIVEVKHVNTEILRENKNLRTELKELKAITETWLNSSNKVNQYISEQIPSQKKRIPGVDQLTEDPSTEGFILPNHDTGRILPSESQRNTTDPSVAVTDSSATDYDSADESSVCSTPLPPLKKLDGAEPIFRPKTIKSILRSKSTFKAEALKGVIINEPSSASAKGNKSSSASKVHSAPAGKLKSVKIKDDPPLAIVMKELNDLKLQFSKNQYERTDHRTCDHVEYISTMNMSQHLKSLGRMSSRPNIPRPLKRFFPPCIHYGGIDHLSNECLYYPICKLCGSYDHDTNGHNRIISLEREINPRNPQHAFKNFEACGSPNHTTTDHYDIEWFKRGEALQAKKAEALKSTKAESSNANISKTPTKSGCSRHMTGVKIYLHKFVEQPGPKVVFGYDSTCTTKIYGSIKCNSIVFTKEIVMIAPRVRDVYVLDMTSSAQESCFFAKAFENLNWFWHKRLAHPNFKTINKLAKQNLVVGLPSLVYSKDKPCSSCEKGKHHRASFKTKQTSSIKKCLHLLHMDLFGPVTPRSINHEKYTLVIVDEYSRSTSTKLCKQFAKLITQRYEMSMMGVFTYFLGFQIKQSERGISINQEKYVKDLLKKYDINGSSVKTLMVPPNNLGPDLNGKSVNETQYRSMIGSLMYLTASRPDIQFLTCLCARYHANPKESHLIVVKRIFRYLKGTPSLGLWYPKCSGFDLKGYSDSDYTGCNMDRKSTSGACQLLGGFIKMLGSANLMCLECKKEAICSYCYCNLKQSSLALKNRYHFIRDHILKGDIELHFIPTQYQLADIFTKPLDKPTFKRLIVELVESSSPDITPKEEPVNLDRPESPNLFLPATQVEFTFNEITFTANNEVALIYPSHPNQEYFLVVSNFISKCYLKEAFTRAPTQYQEYLREFWYTAKTLEDSKVWVSTPTSRVRGEIGITTFRNAIRAHYLPQSSMYVPPPSITTIRPWFSTIGYNGETGAKGTLKKIYLPLRWRLLMGQIIQCLGGKIGGLDQISNKDATILYCLENGVQVDYANIIWEDLIHKLNKKTREKIFPYPRFISLLLEYMAPKYDNEELTINLTQVFSVHNWILKPNQPEEPPFTYHMKAICNLDVPIDCKAPKYSSPTEEVPQGKKPGARSGLRRKQFSKYTSESTTEASKSQSDHSKKETKSSSAMDTSPSHPSPPTHVVGEMHKEAQQAADGPTSLGATSEEGAHPQLSSELLKDTRSAFFTPDSPTDEPILVSDESEEEEVKKVEQPPATSQDVPEGTSVPHPPSPRSAKIQDLMAQLTTLLVTSLKPELAKLLALHDFASCLPTKLKELPSKVTELSEEIKELKQHVKDMELELPGDLQEIPSKLETFTSTISSLSSQVAELKNIQWELPTEFLDLPHLVSSVQEKLKTLDSLPCLLKKVTNTLNRFATLVEKASTNKATASPVEREKDVDTNLKNELVDLLGIDIVTQYYNKKLLYEKYCEKMKKRRQSSKIINCDVLTKKGPISLKVVQACPDKKEKGWKTIYELIKTRIEYLEQTEKDLHIDFNKSLQEQDPLDELNDLANKKRKRTSDSTDHSRSSKKHKSSSST